jgi:hypothetical protein
VGEMIVAGFGGLELLTDRNHWRRTKQQVKPLSEPLARLVQNLPPEVLQRFEKHSDKYAIAFGAVAVTWPSVVCEWLYYKGLKEKQQQRGNEQQSGAGTEGRTTPAQDLGSLIPSLGNPPADSGAEPPATAPAGTNVRGLGLLGRAA